MPITITYISSYGYGYMDKDYLDKVHQSIFRFITFSGSYISGKIGVVCGIEYFPR